MTLPIRTTVDDIVAVCGYLVTKPTGATLPEAKAIVDNRRLDGRKLSAFKAWGLMEDLDDRLKITDLGRQLVKDSGAYRSEALRHVVSRTVPYSAVIERVAHRNEKVLTATEIAAHWHEHFAKEVSDSDKILNDQAICFFHIAQGADLGTMVIGRGGMATRFEFDPEATQAFVGRRNPERAQQALTFHSPEEPEEGPEGTAEPEHPLEERSGNLGNPSSSNRLFLTHGKNLTILEQLKQIVTFGKFEPVVAMEQETLAKPVPQKVMDEMRRCDAAIIHVSVERSLTDMDGNEVQLINENVLIEIGAAMALYGDRFILLVEEGVKLPSNLQGLYECRYKGAELDMPATMKLLEAFNQFGGH